ncbi:MAG: 5-formyltetrahydrofolate cyclo-ligase [Candidatus Helarchaeota archaeon]
MSGRNLRAVKQSLRRRLLALRNSQMDESVIEKSERICARVLHMSEYRRSRVIMLYSGKAKEVQTDTLIRAALKRKRVVLPISDVEKRVLKLSEIKDYDLELEPGAFNILEPKKEYIRPISINQLDLIIVPGIAFDYRGNRLGYGFAYYDKLLSRVHRRIPFMGLAFHFQMYNRLPHSRYDIPMNVVVTEQRIINCR